MSRIKSSFSGILEEIPGIHIDNFENPSNETKAYFLSHYHGDHIVGLGSDALLRKLNKGNNVFIYATKMTAAIIQHNYIDIKPFVKTLNLGSNLITLPSNQDSKEEIYINVTLIPAGHCIGSTMFLFETVTAKILYTGDFRIRPNDIPKYKALHNNGSVIKLDALYVDTTFIDGKYEDFPKRSDSIDNFIDVILRWLDNDDLYVVLDTPAKYGYEHLFNQIYTVLKMKVYVNSERWEFYRTINNLVPSVTNNPKETRIFLSRIPEEIKPVKIVKRIRFSAMIWKEWNDNKSSITSSGDTFYNVCFSTHCSRAELMHFVEYLSPVRIVGFPNPYVATSEGSDSISAKTELSSRKTRKPHESEARPPKDRKVDGLLLKKIFG